MRGMRFIAFMGSGGFGLSAMADFSPRKHLGRSSRRIAGRPLRIFHESLGGGGHGWQLQFDSGITYVSLMARLPMLRM